MGISASKRISGTLRDSPEFNSTCYSVFSDLLSLNQHAFSGVLPYQLSDASLRLHQALSTSNPLVKKWVTHPPSQAQVDHAYRAPITPHLRPRITSKASAFMEFSRLSELHVMDCPNLTSFPHCPSLQEFTLEYGYYGSPEITQELSSTSLFSYTYSSLQKLVIRSCFNLGILHLTCPHLGKIKISNCGELKSIELVGLTEPSLQLLSIKYCETLKSLHIAEHLIACLEKIKIIHCPQLRWSKTQDKRLLVQQGVPKLEKLELHSDRVDSVLVEQSLLSLSFCLCNRSQLATTRGGSVYQE